jgi:hypothetical protein
VCRICQRIHRRAYRAKKLRTNYGHN